jgi:hypothetical protein
VQTAQELLAALEDAMRTLDRARDASAPTMLGRESVSDLRVIPPSEASASMRFPSSQSGQKTTPGTRTLIGRAESWVATHAPEQLRGKIAPRALLAAAAGLTLFVLLVPIAIGVGLLTSDGAAAAESSEDGTPAKIAGIADHEPHAASKTPLPMPSATTSAAATSTATTTATTAAATTRTAKPGATAKASATQKPRQPQQTSSPDPLQDISNRLGKILPK